MYHVGRIFQEVVPPPSPFAENNYSFDIWSYISYLIEGQWKTDQDNRMLGHMSIILFPVLSTYHNVLQKSKDDWNNKQRQLNNQIIKCSNYRVSTKTVSTFVFLMSWLPSGLGIPSWSSLNSPLLVDFNKHN